MDATGDTSCLRYNWNCRITVEILIYMERSIEILFKEITLQLSLKVKTTDIKKRVMRKVMSL